MFCLADINDHAVKVLLSLPVSHQAALGQHPADASICVNHPVLQFKFTSPVQLVQQLLPDTSPVLRMDDFQIAVIKLTADNLPIISHESVIHIKDGKPLVIAVTGYTL